MDEKNVITKNEIDANPASQAAVQLRLMMDKVEGEDKCTLCKAIEELEKASHNQSSNWNFPWFIMIMFLMYDGFGCDKGIDMEGLNAYMDVIKKKAEGSDLKLQNES